MLKTDSLPITLLPGSESFTKDLNSSLKQTQQKIWIQTLSLEADAAGYWLFDLLKSRDIKKRIIIDQFYHAFINDQFIYARRNRNNITLKSEITATKDLLESFQNNNTKIKEVEPLGFCLRKLVARNHKKIIILDDHTAYIGGINFCQHNFAWHDLMLKIKEPDIVQVLKKDFTETWQGLSKPYLIQKRNWSLLSTCRDKNKYHNQFILNQLQQAKNHIKVHTPYLSTPFIDILWKQASNGVRVDLITNQQSNWRAYENYLSSYNNHKNFHIHYYQPCFTHCKAIVIDNKKILLGSSNYDYNSFYVNSELVFLTTDQNLIKEFNSKIWEVDLIQSKEIEKINLNWKRKAYRYSFLAVLALARYLSA